MFLAKIQLPWGIEKLVSAWPVEDQDEFLRRTKTKRKPDGSLPTYYNDIFADDADVQWFLDHGIESITMSRLRGLHSEIPQWGRLTSADVQTAAATSINVHVSNLGLLCMTRVRLLEDACTDALQAELDDGWRILAICPPNSQRRPDYILGKSE